MHLADGLPKVAAANVVPADDETAEIIEVETLQGRQCGRQAGGPDQAAAHRLQAECDGPADAAASPDQPQTNPPFAHE